MAITGTGGVVTTLAINSTSFYRIHTFTGNGNLVLSGVPSSVSAEVLIVAGGGGGGGKRGGGGGAGGVLASSTSLSNGTYPIVVGAGGAGSTGRGASGSNSTVNGLVAVGGGGGGQGSSAGTAPGLPGGSGGGGGSTDSISNGAGGTGTAGQGYAGGNAITAQMGGSGGGGATQAGASRTSSDPLTAKGGNGLTSSISGIATTYGGGGGGGAPVSGQNGGAGGTGGGAAGGNNGSNGNSATANTGGGGGGAGDTIGNTGGTGASGIVVVRYIVSTVGIGGPTSVYEGDAITFNLTTSGLTDGTLVPYTLSGVNPEDIGGASLTGNFVVVNDAASLTLNTTQTLEISGNKTITLTTNDGNNYSASCLIIDVSSNPIITGGVVSTTTPISGRYYKIHTFLNSSVMKVDRGGVVEVLAVAGGGGGGSDMGGGGGGGGVISNAAYTLTAKSYTLTVGLGGSGAPAGVGQVRGYNGGNTIFDTLTAIGGGGGGSEYSTNTNLPSTGGSGGGAQGGTNAGAAGTAGQGYAGGSGGGSWYAGGGGGAGGVGTSGGVSNGGPGILNSILGTAYYWAGGGGGSGYSTTGGSGGIGGGGGGAVNTTTGGSGLNSGSGGGGGAINSQCNTPGGNAGANTGGGGGGGSHYNSNNYGGNGGSGIIVIKYLMIASGLVAPTTANEGDTVSIQLVPLGTTPQGTLIPYTISGVTSADINGASLTGNFVVPASGNASISLTLSLDYTVGEGPETLTITTGNPIPSTTSITILDTSTNILPSFNTTTPAIWTTAISKRLAFYGWSQTADTGQVNTSSLASNSTANYIHGYQIWKMTDSLQPSASVFMKLEFGNAATGTNPALYITLGTGTDGAGNLTGRVSPRLASTSSSNTVTAATSLISGTPASFVCALPSNLGYGVGFSIERTKDSSGNDTAEGVLLHVLGATPLQYYFSFTGILRSTANSLTTLWPYQPNDYSDISSGFVPKMTSFTAPSGTVSASSYYNNVSNYPWNAFATTDRWVAGLGTTGWTNNGGNTYPCWLQYQFPSAVVINDYSITPWGLDNFPSRSPTAWILKGSNDGISWTNLDQQIFPSTSWVLNTPQRFRFTNSNAYLYYRLHITANGGEAYCGIQQLQLSFRDDTVTPMLNVFPVVSYDIDGIKVAGSNLFFYNSREIATGAKVNVGGKSYYALGTSGPYTGLMASLGIRFN